jgi:hypothetical protein
VAHLERSWAVRKQREAFSALRATVAALVGEEDLQHLRHQLRMQYTSLSMELKHLRHGIYQPSTEYLAAHAKDLPGERVDMNRFRRHSVATWYRPRRNPHPVALQQVPVLAAVMARW